MPATWKEQIMINQRIPATLLGAVLVTGSLPLLAADDASSGAWELALRYRLELVDQEPFSEDATASTLRARLNYKTAEHKGFSAFVEFDYVAEIFADDYNAGGGNTPNRGQYPVVADPDGEDLNQAFVQYKHGNNQFRAGRQRIIFDNARFVGNVGWRQNPQTYDAVSYGYKADNGVSFTWAYLDNVNRIFGDDVAAGDHENSTHLLNFSKDFKDRGKLTVYWYDIDNEDAAAFSSTTWGARFAGTGKSGETKIGYTLEFASQGDNANNPTPYGADYYRIDLSAGLAKATLYAGLESMQGNHLQGGKAFRTPLATLHAFNGWADKFLATPAAGLEDVFVGARGQAGAWSWNVLYHDYSAQSGPGNFGSEIDASFSRKLADKYGLLLKAASFDSDSPAYGDTTKFWVQLTAGFK
jgi:hypothetical protein